MALFLTVVLSIYATMHAYLLWRVWVGFPGLGRWRWAIAAFEVAMIAAPVLVRALDRRRITWLAAPLGQVAFIWLAVIFWFCMLMLAADGWNVLVRLLALAAPSAKAAVLPVRAALIGIGALITAALCWGAVEARSVAIEELTVTVPDWPADADSVRLVQISDLHISSATSADQVEQIAGLVRQARPDAIVCTGDLVDSPVESVAHLAGPLADLEAPLGKFAVLGNHEFYTGLKDSLAFHEAAGLKVLRAESVPLNGRLRLAGVDDPTASRVGAKPRTDESAALAGGDGRATVLLKHQPTIDERSLGRYRLQLSGHTHAGQIFPFRYFLPLRYRYYRGRYDLESGSSLYVSPGTGTWGPRLRLLAPPKITVITLRPPR